MPKTNMCKPSELIRIEQELKELCKGARYISTADIGRIYSIQNHRLLNELMSGFKPFVLPSGRKRWKVEDVAKMEYMRRM